MRHGLIPVLSKGIDGFAMQYRAALDGMSERMTQAAMMFRRRRRSTVRHYPQDPFTGR
jgi:hypothetical protein